MNNTYMLLLDSDFIISLWFPKESTHKKAQKLAKKYFLQENVFFLDLVLYEVANVLSRKYSQKKAIKVTKELRSRQESILKLSSEDENKAWQLFYSTKRMNTSFVDCANTIAADSFGLKILSFDSFYKENVLKK